MEDFEARDIMKTMMIRTPASGPEPANTLAYISGFGRAIDGPWTMGKWDRRRIKFRTEFRIDGFAQSQYEWYQANTLVSATGMLRFLNTTTDAQVGLALDRITHFIDPDGRLGFISELGALFDDDAVFSGYNEIVLGYAVSAWILLYEPRTERPPGGQQRAYPGAAARSRTWWKETRVADGTDTYRLTRSPPPTRE